MNHDEKNVGFGNTPESRDSDWKRLDALAPEPALPEDVSSIDLYGFALGKLKGDPETQERIARLVMGNQSAQERVERIRSVLALDLAEEAAPDESLLALWREIPSEIRDVQELSRIQTEPVNHKNTFLKIAVSVVSVMLVTAVTSAGVQLAQKNRALAKVAALQQEINNLGVLDPANVHEMRIVDGNRIEVVGDFITEFFKEARIAFGAEQIQTLEPTGPEADQEGRRERFSVVSQEFRLTGETIAVSVDFVPHAEIKDRLPTFFSSEKLQYSRNFLLSRDGIIPNPDVAEITAPTDGAKVERSDEIEGKLNAIDAWPVIIVKAVGDSQWTVQPPVTQVTDGYFSAQARYGTISTPQGKKFKIVILLANSEQEAHKKYREGETLSAIPSGLPRSKSVTVTRQ